MEDQPIPIPPAPKLQSGLERPYARNRRQDRVVANRRQVRYAQQGLAANGSIAVQLPDRLHEPNISHSFLRQVSRPTLLTGDSGRCPAFRATPEGIAGTANAT